MVTTAVSSPATPRSASAERFVLYGISWETFERIAAELQAAGRRWKLTYDDGALEIEVLGPLHEAIKAFVRAMLEAYLLEQDSPFEPLGATTWKRRMQARGLEADECYYLHNTATVRLDREIDLERDPPPDLAIEVEITEPLLPKLPVYAAIGIAEIWHVQPGGTQILLLERGGYVPVEASNAVPYFTAAIIGRQVAVRLATSHFDAIKQFRAEIAPRDRT